MIRSFRDMPIRWKMVLVVLLTSSAAIIVGGVAAVSYEYARFRLAIVRDLTSQAELVGAGSAAALAFDDAAAAQETLRSLRSRREIFSARLYKPDGSVFAEYVRAGASAAPLTISEQAPGHRFKEGDLVACLPVKVGDNVVGTVCLRSDLREPRARLVSYVSISVVAMLLCLVVALLVGARLQRVISEPISELAQLAHRVAADQNFSVRAHRHSQDEIGTLVDGFNQMLAQIEKREQAERFLSEVTRNMQEGVAVVRASDETIVYANRKFEQMFGYDAGELAGQPVRVVNADTGKRPEQTARDIIGGLNRTGFWTGEVHNRRKDGTPFWCYASISVFQHPEHGKVWVAVHTDVTERRQAEQALRETEQRLEAILDNSAAVIYAKDLNGRYLLINRWFETLTGLGREEIVGKTDYDLFPAERAEAFHANDLEALKSRRPLLFEEVAPQADGLHTYVSVKFPLFDPAGQPYAVCGISTDITEHRRLEREILAISDREQARIGQDLHDGLCQLLVSAAFASRLLETELAEKGLPDAEHAGKMSAVLDDAITQARNIAKGLYPVKLDAEGLSSALHELCAGTTDIYKIACEYQCPAPVAVADPVTAMHLYRIGQEAVHNALKHSGARHIVVELRACDRAVRLTVRDDGCGVPAESGRKTGMGLHIMRYRAGAIGGSLRIATLETGGTEVVCTAPLAPTSSKGVA